MVTMERIGTCPSWSLYILWFHVTSAGSVGLPNRADSITNRADSVLNRASSVLHRADSVLNRASSVLHRASSVLNRASSVPNRAGSTHFAISIHFRPLRRLIGFSLRGACVERIHTGRIRQLSSSGRDSWV